MNPLTEPIEVTSEVLGQVDDVGADVTQRTGPRLVLLETPAHRRRRIGEPVLEVLRADVSDIADTALLHQAAGQGDSGHPTIGEADHRPDPVGGGPVGGDRHGPRLLDGVGQGLLTEHVLARIQCGDRDLGVGVPRRADVDQVDVVALEQTRPVRLGRLPAQLGGRERDPVGIAAAQRPQPGPERQVEEVRCGSPGLGVGGTHERMPDKSDAEDRGGRGHVTVPSVRARGAETGRTGPADAGAPAGPGAQDSNPRSMYSSTFSSVTTGAFNTIRFGTSTCTRSEKPLSCAIRRANRMPSAAWVGG